MVVVGLRMAVMTMVGLFQASVRMVGLFRVVMTVGGLFRAIVTVGGLFQEVDSGRLQGSRDSGRPVQGSCESGRPVQVSRESGRHVLGSRENGRHVTSGHDERKLVPSNGHMHTKVGSHRPSSASGRPGSTSMDSRKQLGSNNAAGPGRPLRPKGPPFQDSGFYLREEGFCTGFEEYHVFIAEITLFTVPVFSSEASGTAKEGYTWTLIFLICSLSIYIYIVFAWSNVIQALSDFQMLLKLHHQIHKPQMNKEIPLRPMAQEHRPRKRPANGFADDEYDPEDGDISSFIIGMFRYNPNKFADDDDDSNMEAGWDDILREERRGEVH